MPTCSWAGTQNKATNPKLISNFTYNTAQGNKNDLGYSAGCTSPNITNNYFASGEALDVNNCSSLTITSNTFYGSTSGFSPSVFPGNTYYGSTRPTGVKVFVRPNAYEAGRANIVVYNWDLACDGQRRPISGSRPGRRVRPPQRAEPVRCAGPLRHVRRRRHRDPHDGPYAGDAGRRSGSQLRPGPSSTSSF